MTWPGYICVYIYIELPRQLKSGLLTSNQQAVKLVNCILCRGPLKSVKNMINQIAHINIQLWSQMAPITKLKVNSH